MATDAFVDKIGIIKPHPDADRLEICFVRSSQCVIVKGVFERFEKVLKIEEDAKLDVTRDWVQPYRNYLGNGDRVKNVRLRGVMSRGLVVSLKELEQELAASLPGCLHEVCEISGDHLMIFLSKYRNLTHNYIFNPLYYNHLHAGKHRTAQHL